MSRKPGGRRSGVAKGSFLKGAFLNCAVFYVSKEYQKHCLWRVGLGSARWPPRLCPRLARRNAPCVSAAAPVPSCVQRAQCAEWVGGNVRRRFLARLAYEPDPTGTARVDRRARPCGRAGPTGLASRPAARPGRQGPKTADSKFTETRDLPLRLSNPIRPSPGLPLCGRGSRARPR